MPPKRKKSAKAAHEDPDVPDAPESEDDAANEDQPLPKKPKKYRTKQTAKKSTGGPAPLMSLCRSTPSSVTDDLISEPDGAPFPPLRKSARHDQRKSYTAYFNEDEQANMIPPAAIRQPGGTERILLRNGTIPFDPRFDTDDPFARPDHPSVNNVIQNSHSVDNITQYHDPSFNRYEMPAPPNYDASSDFYHGAWSTHPHREYPAPNPHSWHSDDPFPGYGHDSTPFPIRGGALAVNRSRPFMNPGVTDHVESPAGFPMPSPGSFVPSTRGFPAGFSRGGGMNRGRISSRGGVANHGDVSGRGGIWRRGNVAGRGGTLGRAGSWNSTAMSRGVVSRRVGGDSTNGRLSGNGGGPSAVSSNSVSVELCRNAPTISSHANYTNPKYVSRMTHDVVSFLAYYIPYSDLSFVVVLCWMSGWWSASPL